MPTEYTPNVEDLARAAYCDYLAGTSRTRDESAAEFDHWLAQVRADAAAQALEDFADEQWGAIRPGRPRFHDELCVRERALAYRKEQSYGTD